MTCRNPLKVLGFVNDVQSVYAHGDIFALSSREEALCSSLFDAMFFKMPIVATSAGGIPEIVKDGVNGYIVPVDDHISFAERLNYLIDHADIRNKMGDRSESILRDNTIDCTCGCDNERLPSGIVFRRVEIMQYRYIVFGFLLFAAVTAGQVVADEDGERFRAGNLDSETAAMLNVPPDDAVDKSTGSAVGDDMTVLASGNVPDEGKDATCDNRC